jgi:hypothetical protein
MPRAEKEVEDGNACPELKRKWKIDATNETDNQIHKHQYIEIRLYLLLLPSVEQKLKLGT